MMDLSQLQSALKTEIANAEYTTREDLNEAMDYYTAEPRGDEIVGRSDIQSHDVADMLEAIVAQIMPAYQNISLASFDPINPEDEQQVDIESKFINYLVMQLNSGYVTMQEALKDALLFRNCIFKVFKDDRVKIRIEDYGFDQIQNPIELELLLAKLQMEAGTDELQLQEDGKIKRIVRTTNLKIESVPPEEFLYSAGWDEVSLDNCPFTAHHRTIIRHDLVEMGFDTEVVNAIPRTSSIFPNNENVRDNDSDKYYERSTHKDSDPIDYYECYYVVDYDGDGYSELRKVCLASERVILNEEVDFHTFVGGTAIMMPHRFRGISTYDQQKDVQDAKTKILRQYVDNMNHMNNRRMEVEVRNIIDMNDVLNSRPAGVVKSKKIGSVAPIPVSDIGTSCELFLNYLDKVRTNRSGASLDMVSENLPVGGETAHGAERIISSKEQMAALASNTFKETSIKPLFLLVHKTVRKYFSGVHHAKVLGEWVSTDPSTWLERKNVAITIGASQGETIKKLQSLGSIIEQQVRAQGAGQGNILVTAKNVYNSLTDYSKESGVEIPERYWNNPENELAQQTIKSNSDDNQKQQALQEKLQVALMKTESMRVQVQDNANRSKNTIDQLKHNLDVAKASANAAKEDENLRFDVMKHFDDLAMQITSLEAQYNGQINDYQENKGQVQ